MSLQHLILATAGHVDHGKTALIKALTGVETDRLPQEKARGITIELGFAHLALPGFSLGVIDVPGHEDFVRNMIAGLGAIDLALLVVAVDDGWMPQTEEHLQILHYLGVRHGIVAITKCDLGDSTRTAAEVRGRLQGTSLGEAPIVAVSSRTGDGLEELKAVVAQVGGAIPAARDTAKPRLFVDRVFTVRGAGTVVTGTLSGGRLDQGETVSLLPQNSRAHIRAIQSHDRPVEFALPATRTALNLPELRVEEIPRGSIVTTTVAAPATSRVIDALIERSSREFLPARPLKNGSVIQVHYGSARFTARIVFLVRRDLLPGASDVARLRFATPVFVFVGDRFILRDSSGRQTIAGGVVLDPEPGRTRFRSLPARKFLETRAAAPNDLATLLRTQLCRKHFAERKSLLTKSNFSELEIADAIDRLARAGEIFLNDNLAADGAWWDNLRRRAMDLIDAEHRTHSERAGLELADLRAALSLDDALVCDALVADLSAEGFPTSKGSIRRETHRPCLPAALAEAGAKIRAALAAKPFDPPARHELAPDLPRQQALRFLCENGEVIQLSAEIVLSATAFGRMKNLVSQTLRAHGAATASELRQELGTTRRVLIPFLEHCDRFGLTRRAGDQRVLR